MSNAQSSTQEQPSAAASGAQSSSQLSPVVPVTEAVSPDAASPDAVSSHPILGHTTSPTASTAAHRDAHSFASRLAQLEIASTAGTDSADSSGADSPPSLATTSDASCTEVTAAHAAHEAKVKRMIEANLARERKILVYLQSTPVTQERKDQLKRDYPEEYAFCGPDFWLE